MSESIDQSQPRMTIRRMPFTFVASHKVHWNGEKPEFSQIVNAASFAMPFLEPYLIRAMRKARSEITDPALREQLDQYVSQEGQHYQQHKKYNDSIAAEYSCVDEIEKTLAADYRSLDKKSLKFKLAYAEGFESMALAIGNMLIADREYLFGKSDSTVASLILWHFVEEIEHKSVAFDVYDYLYGSYFWRVYGFIYATVHIFFRSRQAYRLLLKQDGLWRNWKSRWRLARLLLRIFKNLTPRLLAVFRPGYHPEQISDPQWVLDWIEMFKVDAQQTAQLDTNRFSEPSPAALIS